MLVACPHCGKQLNAPPNLAGRTATCPHCKGRFSVAAPAAIPVLPPPPMPVDPFAGEDDFGNTGPVDAVIPAYRRRIKSKNSFALVASLVATGAFLIFAIVWMNSDNHPDKKTRPVVLQGQRAFDEPENTTSTNAGQLVSSLLFLAMGVFLYFLPTIVAVSRKHQNAAAIAMLNILLGWTFLGWVVAIVWAFTESRSRDHHHYHYH